MMTVAILFLQKMMNFGHVVYYRYAAPAYQILWESVHPWRRNGTSMKSKMADAAILNLSNLWVLFCTTIQSSSHIPQSWAKSWLFFPKRSSRRTPLAWHVERVVSRRDVTSQVEFGLMCRQVEEISSMKALKQQMQAEAFLWRRTSWWFTALRKVLRQQHVSTLFACRRTVTSYRKKAHVRCCFWYQLQCIFLFGLFIFAVFSGIYCFYVSLWS